MSGVVRVEYHGGAVLQVSPMGNGNWKPMNLTRGQFIAYQLSTEHPECSLHVLQLDALERARQLEQSAQRLMNEAMELRALQRISEYHR